MKTLVTIVAAALCILLMNPTAWAQTIYTSTADGVWSTMTWSPAGTPGELDDVIIADGNTVTINQAVTIANLTVGQGTSGTLTFDAAAHAVAVSGNVTVASGATFITQLSGASTHTMSVGGDLTNNGTFDMSRNSSTTVCNVTFTKAGDQTISGAATLTRFRGVTLNKGSVSNRVVSSIDVTMAGSQLFAMTTGTWEQTAGTLSETSGSQTIGSNGALIISGSGSFSMVIAGSWAVNGTLTVNTSGSFSMGSGNNNLTPSATGTVNFTAGTVTIFGRLTLSGGNTTINGATIKIDPQSTNSLTGTSNTFECSGTANLTFSSGSVTLVNPDTAGAATRTGRDLKINSTGTLNLSGSTFYFGDGVSTKTGLLGFLISTTNIPLGNLVLQTGGIAGRNVGLATSVVDNGNMTFVNGLLTLGAQNLTLGATSTISGTSSSSYIVADGTGSLKKTFTADDSFDFPVGDNTVTPEFSPASLTFTGGSYSSAVVSVRVVNAKHPNNTSATDFLNRYWVVTQSGITGFSCAATFNYVPADVAGTEAGIDLGSWNGASWADLGACNPVTHTLSGTVTSFSDFTGGEPVALPIQLASFTGAAISNNAVRLDWMTLSEINNYGFFVQRRRASEQTFTELPNSFIPGHGTTLVPQHYTFTDNAASVGHWFYRLKQVDLDGRTSFTDPIEVDVLTGVPEVAPVEFSLYQNYPNPFNPSTEIKFSVEANGPTTLSIYNTLGQEVFALFKGIAEAGQYYSVKLDASNFASGMYFYKLESGQKTEMKKMLLLK